uniref:Uncharacterized protein n=1 Tax=Tanacetum cinerariifolium TaxID=118510 RepID=A0A6L2K5Z3_TANCI|nr:hypothetical protein [Tanacetum cinerariifolium]
MPPFKHKNTQKPRKPKRKDAQVPQLSVPIEFVADKAVNKEMNDSLEKATTTVTSLDAKQDKGNIAKTQYKATSNEPSSQGTSLCDGPSRQDTIGDTCAHTRVISSSDDEALDKEDTDADEDIALEEVVKVVSTAKMIIDVVVDTTQVTTAIVDIPVSATETIVTTAPTITIESTKKNVKVTQAPKTKGVMIQEPEEPTTKKQLLHNNLRFGTKQERAQKEQEANDALIITWDDIQAKIDADAQLVLKLHEKEQLQLIEDEKAKLFMEFIEKRKKFFAAKRDEEKMNEPPTKAQQRNIMTELVVEGLKKDKVTEGSLKRTGEELEQKIAKKQKIEDDKESAKLK